MYVTSLDLGSLGQNYFHSVRSVPFQLQAKPQSHGPIIEALLKSVFTVYKYSPNKMAIGRKLTFSFFVGRTLPRIQRKVLFCVKTFTNASVNRLLYSTMLPKVNELVQRVSPSLQRV